MNRKTLILCVNEVRELNIGLNSHLPKPNIHISDICENNE